MRRKRENFSRIIANHWQYCDFLRPGADFQYITHSRTHFLLFSLQFAIPWRILKPIRHEHNPELFVDFMRRLFLAMSFENLIFNYILRVSCYFY
jgi:hypothetical protein